MLYITIIAFFKKVLPLVIMKSNQHFSGPSCKEYLLCVCITFLPPTISQFSVKWQSLCRIFGFYNLYYWHRGMEEPNSIPY